MEIKQNATADPIAPTKILLYHLQTHCRWKSSSLSTSETLTVGWGLVFQVLSVEHSKQHSLNISKLAICLPHKSHVIHCNIFWWKNMFHWCSFKHFLGTSTSEPWSRRALWWIPEWSQPPWNDHCCYCGVHPRSPHHNHQLTHVESLSGHSSASGINWRDLHCTSDKGNPSEKFKEFIRECKNS